MLITFIAVNRREDIELKAKEASMFSKTLGQMNTCTFFYIDIGQDSYNYIFSKRDGIIEKYEKDCDGDPANPINGQISGLTFTASTEKIEGSLHPSKSEDKRIGIVPSHLLTENTNLYFSSLYSCDDQHWVQLVLCKNRSKADVTCSKLLIKLNKYNNPFLYISKTDPKIIKGTTGVDVEVFYTHDVKATGNVANIFMGIG